MFESLKSGRARLLSEGLAESDLIQAVRAVAAGKAYFSPAVSKILADDYVRQVKEQVWRTLTIC